ncbi:transglutaminase-like domain-containing protein [Archaeoglobus sp.]
MRRIVITTSLISLLLIAFLSGCISQSQTQTITVTETKTHTEYVPITPSTTTTSTSSPAETSSTMTPTTTPQNNEEGLIKVDCQNERWRDDYEKAMVCILSNTRYIEEGLSKEPKQVALRVAKELGNNFVLDAEKENQSMIKGYYFNILTPKELEQTKKGTYADFAMYGAVKLLSNGVDTYMVYIKTEKGFGLLPAFKIEPNGKLFLIFWPYIIPITLGSAKELLDYGGDPLQYAVIYHIELIEGSEKVNVRKLEKIDRLQILDDPNEEFTNTLWKIKKDLPTYIKEELGLINPLCDVDTNLRPDKEYEVYLGPYQWLYSAEFHEEVLKAIAKDLVANIKQQDEKAWINCDKYYIAEITPMNDRLYVHVFFKTS